MGLNQILEDSTDTGSSEEGDNSENSNVTPNEIVLQVTADEQQRTEQLTACQHLNPR